MGPWSSRILERAGIPLDLNPRTKQAKPEIPWIESISQQRPQEIPLYLKEGYFDLGIVGQDWLANWQVVLPQLMTVAIGRGGGRVKIVVAAPQDSGIKNPTDYYDGLKVATEYMMLAEQYFGGLGIVAKIIPSYGNTEQKVLYGADVIIDVTETGNSLRQNGLEIVDIVMESSMALVARNEVLEDPQLRDCVEYFVCIFKGAVVAESYIRVEANVPVEFRDEASAILKGMKGATVSPLEREGWISMTSYVKKSDEACVVFDLVKLGVKDIAVIRDIPLLMGM